MEPPLKSCLLLQVVLHLPSSIADKLSHQESSQVMWYKRGWVKHYATLNVSVVFLKNWFSIREQFTFPKRTEIFISFKIYKLLQTSLQFSEIKS